MDVHSFKPRRERRAHIPPPQQLKDSNQLIITSFTYHPAHEAEFSEANGSSFGQENRCLYKSYRLSAFFTELVTGPYPRARCPNL